MILPADSYVIINKSIITDLDKKVLIDLYQPIIGNKAISLYYTFLNDLDKNIYSSELTHYHLLSVMQLSLDEINIARERLEAVGLVKTYFKKGNINNYVYMLYSPLTPNEFLNHPMLNVVLYNNLGKKEYEKIVEAYKMPRINLKDYDDISLSFEDVFTSVPSSSFFQNEDLISKNKNEIKFKNEVDFSLLIEGLKISEKAFTKEVRYLITTLSYLYNIDILTMQNLIKSSLTEKGSIDKEYLRKACRNFYQFENSGNLPTLIHTKQPEHLKSPAGDTSKKALMIYTFENTNPYQFIKSKYKDGKVITRDLNLIESLLIDLKLTPGVVNVLLDYVLRTNNQKLNKAYIETIASSWKRLGIETVEEAMNQCIKAYNKKSKQTKKEVVPSWFNEQIEKKELDKEEENELVELFKDYN